MTGLIIYRNINVFLKFGNTLSIHTARNPIPIKNRIKAILNIH